MKENCAECKHHDVFWGGSGCNLLNNGERCKFYPKVMTNADRIRSMSDEELAKFIHEPFCDNRTHEECTIYYCWDCYQCGLDWLRQPAEKPKEEGT